MFEIFLFFWYNKTNILELENNMEKDIKHLINKFLYLYLAVSCVVIVFNLRSNLEIAYIHMFLSAIILIITTYQQKTLIILINGYINKKVSAVDSYAKTSYKTFPVSIVITTKDDYKVKWFNEEFSTIFCNSENVLDKEIPDIISELTPEKLKNHQTQFPCEQKIGDKIYRIYTFADSKTKETINFYFTDVTQDAQIRTAYESEKPIISIISIDNYDELLRNSTDTEKSIIEAAINTRINAWTKEANGIFRKFDRDRYLFIFSSKQIAELTEQKFPILDSIREIQTTEGITATLSIGIGRDGDTLSDSYEFALNALDMALSRGGDQAVIKNKYSFEFYGGMSKEVEKRTKVKSRVVAGALNTIIKQASDVYVMGHQVSDFDSVGSAIGICAALKNNDKPHKIVIDIEKSSAKPLINRLLKNDTYKDIFITPEEALIKLTPETLLIIVDTNRPDYVESKQLLEAAEKVVLIDHHRRAADYIENTTVTMHEPYASSTCEIVTELLQYMLNTTKISKTEAEALLCGIMLDTKNFSSKTGSRTFEAAAYLKRIGADVDSVKLLFQNDFDTYQAKQNITNTADIYDQKYLIAKSSQTVDRALASQAADELLNIAGVHASFVIFKTGNGVNISARSGLKANVQVIMERLGGGGSMTAAAAQFENDTTDNVERLLKEILDNLDNQLKMEE